MLIDNTARMQLAALLAGVIVVGACGPSSSTGSAPSGATNDAYIAAAKAELKTYETPQTTWLGPTTGPKMVAGKKIVLVYNGIYQYEVRVKQDVENLAKIVGWQLTTVTQPTSDSSGINTFAQAIALKPDAIIAAQGSGALNQRSLDAAAAQGIKVVATHFTAYPGPNQLPGLLDVVQADPRQIGKAMVDYAVVHSNATARAIILYTKSAEIAKAKGDEWAKAVQACSTCTLLEMNDNLSVFQTASGGATLMASWVGKYGSSPFWVFSISDDFFDSMIPTLRNAGIDPKMVMLGASDGSVSAFQRIRTGQYQVMTGAEPDQEEVYSVFDDLNRAFQNQPIAGFLPRYYLTDKTNVNLAGGDQSQYIPQDNFAAHYLALWGLG